MLGGQSSQNVGDVTQEPNPNPNPNQVHLRQFPDRFILKTLKICKKLGF